MKISEITVKCRVSDIIRAVELLEEVSPLSLSRLQRRLDIGYGRVAAIMDLFEALGIISPQNALNYEHTPLVTSREAVIRVIGYLHETLASEACDPLCFEEQKTESPLMDWSDLDFTAESETVAPLTLPSLEERLREAVECACSRERIGTSALQRTLRIGYGRAAALMDRMEELGIVGPDPGDKSGREVLLSLEEALSRLPAEDTVIVSPSHTQARVDPPALSPSEMLRKAVEVACSRERIGPSALQRSMHLGYGRAATLIDQMEKLGIIGPDPCDKTGREVLLTLEEALARLPAEEN